MLQKGLALLGIAKQTAKGTPAAAPTYTIGLTGGAVGKVEIDQSDLDTTWDTRGKMGAERKSIVPGADIETVATPAAIGLLLKLALGAEAVTGSGPYVHTFTPGGTLPYATLFSMFGGGNKTAISDAKIDSLELSWDGTGAVRVKVTSMGCTYDMASAWVVGSTKESVANGNVIRPGGGSFSINSVPFPVTAGSIKIENSVDAILSSASGLPSDIAEKDLSVTISLTTMPDDIGLFKLAATGTETGTSLTTEPVFVPVSIDLTGPGTVTLSFDFPALGIMAAMPESDPNGGAAEIQVQGSCYASAGGSDSISAVLTNAVTAAY